MKKGRSEILIEARNKALCERFIYWTETVRLRFDDAIKKLSQEEFFISEERVMCLLRKGLNGQRIQAKKKPRKICFEVIPFFEELKQKM